MVKDRSSHLSTVCLHQYHYPYKCRIGNDPKWALVAELYEMAGNSFQRSVVFNLWLTTRNRGLMSSLKSDFAEATVCQSAVASWSKRQNDTWKFDEPLRSRDYSINAMCTMQPDDDRFWARNVSIVENFFEAGDCTLETVWLLCRTMTFTGGFTAQHVLKNLKAFNVMSPESPESITWKSHKDFISPQNTTEYFRRVVEDWQYSDCSLDLAPAPKKLKMGDIRSFGENAENLVELRDLSVGIDLDKSKLGEFIILVYRRYVSMIQALAGATIRLTGKYYDGKRFSRSFTLEPHVVAQLIEISTFLTNACMVERAMEDRWKGMLPPKSFKRRRCSRDTASKCLLTESDAY